MIIEESEGENAYQLSEVAHTIWYGWRVWGFHVGCHALNTSAQVACTFGSLVSAASTAMSQAVHANEDDACARDLHACTTCDACSAWGRDLHLVGDNPTKPQQHIRGQHPEKHLPYGSDVMVQRPVLKVPVRRYLAASAWLCALQCAALTHSSVESMSQPQRVTVTVTTFAHL